MQELTRPGDVPQPTAGAALAPESADASDVFDLGRLVKVLWGYRGVVLGTTLAALLAYGGLLVAKYVLGRVRQAASISFTLPFTSRYPNDAPFSPSDIVAIPVLEEVYASNDLDRFMDFGEFRRGVLVIQSSARLDMLVSEYRTRLAEARLAASDRARIEAEFARKRDELLAQPNYVLTFARESRTTIIPGLTLNKVLADVLAVWAKQAAERKGVLRSKLTLFSRGALRSDLAAIDEPAIAADTLRVRAMRLLESVDTITAIPGASSARTGNPGYSMADVTARIQNAIAVRVAPVLVRLQDSGVSASRPSVRAYFDARLAQVTRSRDESALRVAALRRSVGEVVASATPPDAASPSGPGRGRQGGSAADAAAGVVARSFMQSLLQMSTRKEEGQFRRAAALRLLQEVDAFAALQAEVGFYQRAVSTAPRRDGASAGAAMAGNVTAQLALGVEAIEKAVDDLNVILQQLLDRNLTPSAMLYAVTQPVVVTTTSGLTGSTPLTTSFLIVALCLVLVPIACLMHFAFSDRDAVRV
jgi:hypothetical protein